jgi:hypothetical protein
MRPHPEMKAVPMRLRADFNALLVLQQYFPKSRSILQRKEAARRRIADHLDRQGHGRTLQVERVTGLSPAEFRRRYLRQDIPVILDQAAAHWTCCKAWSFDAFKQRFGTATIKFVERQGLTDDTFIGEDDLTEEIVFSDFLDAALSGGRKYMRFSPLLEKFPELAADFDDTFLQTMADGSLGVSYLLFIGGKGSATPLHNAMTPFFFVNVCGVKRWTLIPNTYLAILNPLSHGLGYNHSKADLAEMNLDEFPGLGSIDRLEAVMHPGDVLFVPAWAWHSVRNDSPTIGVRCGLMRPTSMIGSSPTLAWIGLFAARDPSMFQVFYRLATKKRVAKEQWPRVYWRWARRPSGHR